MSVKTITSRNSTLTTIWKGHHVFLLNIICPDNNAISKVHAVRETVRDVINGSCASLEISHSSIFGIALHEHNEYRFISPKKSLYRFLPSAAMVTSEQATQLNDFETRLVLDSTIKSCRVYLRVRYFYINVDVLEGRSLYYYYEQVRLDSLKYQNWLNVDGFGDIFHSIAAKTLWLTYGSKASEMLQNSAGSKLHYYLPQYEKNLHTINIINEMLNNISVDLDVNNNNEEEAEKVSDFSRDYYKIPDIKVNNCDVENYKNSIMLLVIKDAVKLPFYGMYYYHITLIQNDERKLPNCKLGIGPLGLSILYSPDFTTWDQMHQIPWISVDDFSFDKNILDIRVKAAYSTIHSQKLYHFQCIDEKEAKYLFKQLRESKIFQLKSFSKLKKRRDEVPRTKRNNSIGIVSSQMAAMTLSPIFTRSTSLQYLRPRSVSCEDKYDEEMSTEKLALCRTKSS